MKKHYGQKNWRKVMPVKFWQTIIRFWFFLSYLITTVIMFDKSFHIGGVTVTDIERREPTRCTYIIRPGGQFCPPSPLTFVGPIPIRGGGTDYAHHIIGLSPCNLNLTWFENDPPGRPVWTLVHVPYSREQKHVSICDTQCY